MNERFCPHFKFEPGEITTGTCTLEGRTPRCTIASDWAPGYFNPAEEKGMIIYITHWQRFCSGNPKLKITDH